jgi:hypothetical protein
VSGVRSASERSRDNAGGGLQESRAARETGMVEHKALADDCVIARRDGSGGWSGNWCSRTLGCVNWKSGWVVSNRSMEAVGCSQLGSIDHVVGD